MSGDEVKEGGWYTSMQEKHDCGLDLGGGHGKW